MAYPEILDIEHGVIIDLEIENMQLRDDLEATQKKLEEAEALLAITTDVLRGNAALFGKRYIKARAESDKLSELWRDHLDECDPEDDNDWESEARQILYDAGDIEKKIAVDGYDKSEREYVPF